MLERAELLRLLWEDPIRFARMVLPEWFPTPMPWVHRGIVALVLQRTDFLLNFGEEGWQDTSGEWNEGQLLELVENFTYSREPDNPDSPKIPLFVIQRNLAGAPVSVDLTTSRFLEVMLPRGVSKTTLFNFLIVFSVAFKLTKFTVYISESQTHAERQLGNVKRVLEQNSLFRELFGNLVPERNDPQKWTEDFIETLSGISIMARGRGSQIRGANVDAKRPDKILIDDVEDPESVRTPEQRKKTLDWLMGDVRPALPRHTGSIFVLGTMLHAEAMLPTLATSPNWIVVRFGAMLDSGVPLWPWYMTRKKWELEKAEYTRLGKIDLFYMEYQSAIRIDSENRKFRPELWRTEVMERVQFEAVALACDPAISGSADADSWVAAVVGMTARGRLHLLDLYGRKGMSPREQVDKLFEMHIRWDVTFHGIEAIAYQQALIHIMQEEMHRKSAQYGNKAYFAIRPLKHGKTGKIARVEGLLAPRYSAGYITHQRHFQALHEEALDWPHGKKDHLDAVAMAISLLDPVAAFAVPRSDDPKQIELDRRDWEEIQDAHAACP